MDLLRRAGQEIAAERAARQEVETLRSRQRPGAGARALLARRNLARALCMHARALAGIGEAERGLAVGREGLEVGRAVLAATPADDPERDYVVGLLASSLRGVGEVADRAGHPDQRADLWEECVGLCRGGDRRGYGARNGLSLVLHRQVTVAAEEADAVGHLTGTLLEDLIERANEVVAIRRELVHDDVDDSQRYLARALHPARSAARCHRPVRRGRSALDAWTALGDDKSIEATQLRDQLSETMRNIEVSAPSAVRRLDWPWKPMTLVDAQIKRRRKASRSTEWRNVLPALNAAAERESSLDVANPLTWRRVPSDPDAAAERGSSLEVENLLTTFAQRGELEAMQLLGVRRRRAGYFDEADHWFRRSAEAGNVDSMYTLGTDAFARGDYETAQRWLNEAGTRGDARARYEHGTILANALNRVDDAIDQWRPAAARTATSMRRAPSGEHWPTRAATTRPNTGSPRPPRPVAGWRCSNWPPSSTGPPGRTRPAGGRRRPPGSRTRAGAGGRGDRSS